MNPKCSHTYKIGFLGIDPEETWLFCNKCGASHTAPTQAIETLQAYINQQKKDKGN